MIPIKHELDGKWYTVDELSELSGVKSHTIRDRLRRGFPIEEALKLIPLHESVREFGDSSNYTDWVGMSVNDLHKIYWEWSIRNGYSPLQKQGFSRQLTTMYPMLKMIPIKKCGKSYRVVRLKERL